MSKVALFEIKTGVVRGDLQFWQNVSFGMNFLQKAVVTVFFAAASNSGMRLHECKYLHIFATILG